METFVVYYADQHGQRFCEFEIRQARNYHYVGRFEATDREDLFHNLNDNPDLKDRSLSVGDIILDLGVNKYYAVDGVGFSEVEGIMVGDKLFWKRNFTQKEIDANRFNIVMNERKMGKI